MPPSISVAKLLNSTFDMTVQRLSRGHHDGLRVVSRRDGGTSTLINHFLFSIVIIWQRSSFCMRRLILCVLLLRCTAFLLSFGLSTSQPWDSPIAIPSEGRHVVVLPLLPQTHRRIVRWDQCIHGSPDLPAVSRRAPR